jgi:hypothetical protein
MTMTGTDTTIDVDALMARLTRLPNYEAIRNHLASSHSAPEAVGAGPGVPAGRTLEEIVRSTASPANGSGRLSRRR